MAFLRVLVRIGVVAPAAERVTQLSYSCRQMSHWAKLGSNRGHALWQELLARSGGKLGVPRDSIGCLDNISSSKTTQYNTYGYRYHRTALEMAPSEGPAGTRNPTVARERRAVATAARRAPHAIVTARASTTRLVPEATSCAHASAHAGRKAVA